MTEETNKQGPTDLYPDSETVRDPAPEPTNAPTEGQIPNVAVPQAQGGNPQPQPQQDNAPGKGAPPPQKGAEQNGPHNIFRSIFETLAGPQYKPNPNTGEMEKVKMNKSDLANSIVAGALTGMFAGVQEKGPGATAKAFGAGGQASVKMHQENTKQNIENYGRKAATLEQNLHLRLNAAAVSQAETKNMDAFAQHGKDLLAQLQDTPGAILNDGQTFKYADIQDIMKKYNVTNDLAIPVGTQIMTDPNTGQPILDKDGVPKKELTYALVNPAFNAKISPELQKLGVKWNRPGIVNGAGEPIGLPKDAKSSILGIQKLNNDTSMLEHFENTVKGFFNIKDPAVKTQTTPGLPDLTEKSVPQLKPEEVTKVINDSAKANKVDPRIIRAMIGQESGGDAGAVSNKGAAGMMQLMDDTAKQLGVKNRLDPKENIQAGTKYFSELYKRFDKNLTLALAAYNAGPGKVEKAGNKVPNYKETTEYVTKIMGKLGMKPDASVMPQAVAASESE